MDLLESSGTGPTAYQFSIEELERPVISIHQAQAVVREQWGMDVLSVKELGSYEDRNFLISGGGGRYDKLQKMYKSAFIVMRQQPLQCTCCWAASCC